MNAEVLKQKVNFYISVIFIIVFGIFMTTTVVNAINHDSVAIQHLEDPTDVGQ